MKWQKKDNRETSKYLFKVGNKVVHGGITDRDLSERERELKGSGKVTREGGRSYDWAKGHIVKTGNKTTREAGLKWERDNGYGADQDQITDCQNLTANT